MVSMTTQATAIDHNGTTYTAVPGKIGRTYLGFHEHYRMVAELGIELPGSGYINIGDYSLNQGGPGEAPSAGTAFGMDYVMHVLRAVGSDAWEDLKGSRILILFKADSEDGMGLPALGLARIDGTHVVVFSELSASWEGRGH